MQANRASDLKVGLFVLAALVAGAAIVFSVGNQRNLFTKKTSFRAHFGDVGGLRAGSSVRVAGVHVGTVTAVRLLNNGRTEVRLEVSDEAKGLIRQGSVASIGSKGMLGDKLVEVSVGDGRALHSGALLRTRDSFDLAHTMRKVSGILDDAQGTAHNLRRATEPLATSTFAQDLKSTTHNIARLSAMAAEGRGTVQRLLTDRELATTVAKTTQNLERVSAELRGTLQSVRAIVDEIKSGNGTGHALIYGQEGKTLMRGMADATGELALLLRDVRTGDGALHDLIYEDKANRFLSNLTTVSEDLKAISGSVRKGEGTVGRLLTDPSLFEDLKRLVGDLERNAILKALVRYSIKRGEQRPAARVKTRTPR